MITSSFVTSPPDLQNLSGACRGALFRRQRVGSALYTPNAVIGCGRKRGSARLGVRVRVLSDPAADWMFVNRLQTSDGGVKLNHETSLNKNDGSRNLNIDYRYL